MFAARRGRELEDAGAAPAPALPLATAASLARPPQGPMAVPPLPYVPVHQAPAWPVPGACAVPPPGLGAGQPLRGGYGEATALPAFPVPGPQLPPVRASAASLREAQFLAERAASQQQADAAAVARPKSDAWVAYAALIRPQQPPPPEQQPQRPRPSSRAGVGADGC